MSIFNTRFENGIDIRANTGYFEDLFQKNHLTKEFERVGSGSENPVTLPDYLRDNSINFRNTEEVLNGPKLDSIKADHDKLNEIDTLVLPAIEVSVEQIDQKVSNIENSILPAHEASLEELDTRVLTNSNKILAVENVNTTQNTKITALENKTASITKPGTIPTLISAINSKFYIDNNGTYVFNSSASSTPTPPYLKLNPSSLELFTAPTSSVYLDVSRIDKLAKILQVTDSTWDTNLSITKPLLLTGTSSTTDVTNKKMMIIDNTSKTVSYTDIPASTVIDANMLKYLNDMYIPSYYKVANVNAVRDITKDANNVWKFSSNITPSASFNFTNELILDFIDMPLTTDASFYLSGKYYAIHMQEITTNDAVSIQYFPHENDNLSAVSFKSYITSIPFNTLPKPFIRLEILLPNSSTLPREFKGKLKISVKKVSTTKDATPTATIGPTG